MIGKHLVLTLLLSGTAVAGQSEYPLVYEAKAVSKSGAGWATAHSGEVATSLALEYCYKYSKQKAKCVIVYVKQTL